MRERQRWQWRFLGFETMEYVRPVQHWFNDLPDVVKEEIADLVNHLRVLTDREWRKPDFDPLHGAGGISELRPYEKQTCYRIYGFFGPGKHEYTLLFGNHKAVHNDRLGKGVAKERLVQLGRNHGGPHFFA